MAARILLADSPEDLMRDQHVFSQANLAVGNAIGRSHRAKVRLASDEAKAGRRGGRWRSGTPNSPS